MNYEIESALRQKVDEWKFSSLQQKCDKLENEIHSLERRLSYVESKLSNHSDMMTRLVQLMIDSETIEDVSALHEIKNYL